MKKYIFILVCLSCLGPLSFSQDKIITKSSDTIDCKITKITGKTIFFDVSTKGITSSGSIPLKDITSYMTPYPDPVKEELNKEETPSFNRLRLGINAGIGYITSSSKQAEKQLTGMGMNADKVRSYYRNLKLGNIANADLTYYFSERIGAGIKYKVYENSASVEDFMDPQDGVNIYYTNIKETIYVNYVAGAFYYEQYSRDRKLKVNTSLSIGMTSYRDEAEILNNYLLTGKSVGLDCSLSLEYFFKPQFSIFADVTSFASTLTKVKYNDGYLNQTIELDKENYENLSRIDFSLGIKLYLGK